jgi:hypothetical protein
LRATRQQNEFVCTTSLDLAISLVKNAAKKAEKEDDDQDEEDEPKKQSIDKTNVVDESSTPSKKAVGSNLAVAPAAASSPPQDNTVVAASTSAAVSPHDNNNNNTAIVHITPAAAAKPDRRIEMISEEESLARTEALAAEIALDECKEAIEQYSFAIQAMTIAIDALDAMKLEQGGRSFMEDEQDDYDAHKAEINEL